MRKIYLLSLCVILVGCKTSPQPEPRVSLPLIKKEATAADIEAWTHPDKGMTLAIPRRNVRTKGLPPLPPVAVPRSRALKSLSVEEPDKWIVVRWDADPDSTVSYVLQWQAKGSNVFCGIPTAQSKVDLVALFKERQLEAGWYQVQVLSINELFVLSEPVSAVTLFWKP